ncbi:MAG: hypothetical protein OEV40_19290 [Acidimicrobiia bacterium]|nr:hypothetical protein [Acidimicrobiia bacterium]
MVDSNDQRSEALRGAAQRRVELKQALSQVEIAAAAPSGDPGWRDRLLGQLELLRIALDQHVEEVEAPDGLLPELLAEAPRLANQIAVVQDEHPMLTRQVAAAIELATSSADIPRVRAEVLDALNAIVRHRQAGADLVYEGYSVDIGGQ